MAGAPNLFSSFGFKAGSTGKLDNNTRAFFSKFSGRIGPALPDVQLTGDDGKDWQTIALTANALIREFEAQGWIERGFDGDETAYSNAIRAVTMIPAATEWGYAPY